LTEINNVNRERENQKPVGTLICAALLYFQEKLEVNVQQITTPQQMYCITLYSVFSNT